MTRFYRLSLAVVLMLLAACQPMVRPVRPAISETHALPDAPEVAIQALEEEPTRTTAEGSLPPHQRLSSGEAVFTSFRSQLANPQCAASEPTRAWQRRYAGHPETFARHLREILPLFAYVLEHTAAANLPSEFALIPLVESWYRPSAMGLGGPAGLWQMIASTGRNNGLRIDSGYDGRLSPIDSTAAALNYLQALHGQFDDWRATAMAYNAGENRLLRSFQRSHSSEVSGERHLPKGLSRTTYDYVIKLQALACLFAEPERSGLQLPLTPFTPLHEVALPQNIASLDNAARTLSVDTTMLRKLNPAFRYGRISTNAPRRLLVPNSTSQLVTQAAITEASPPENPTRTETTPQDVQAVHVVQSGDTLWKLARRYSVGINDLLRWNGLRKSSVLRLGQTLRLAQ